jgi:hypothetical protein
VSEIPSVVDVCPHCHQRTALEGKAKVVKAKGGDNYHEPYWVEHWELRQCVSCGQPILRETLFVDIDEGDASEKTLFPTPTRGSMAGIPESVAKAYEAARSVQSIEPNAYAVLVGRLLEAIAVEQGLGG